MYDLYYFPGNANLAPHMALEECGARYRLVLVDRTRGEQKSPAYRRLNPHGRIPVLVDAELVLYEAAAICVYLADRHPEARLAPPAGAATRGLFHQWLVFLASTLQPELMLYHYPERYAAGPEAARCVRAAAEANVAEHFDRVDEHLAARPHLLGSQPGVCDLYLLMLAHWAREHSRPPAARPHLRRSLDRLARREAVRRAFAAEGLDAPRF